MPVPAFDTDLTGELAREQAYLDDARGERFYVGRRHVSDEAGDPMVVDWRARISLAFYRASRASPLRVATSAGSSARTRPCSSSVSIVA